MPTFSCDYSEKWISLMRWKRTQTFLFELKLRENVPREPSAHRSQMKSSRSSREKQFHQQTFDFTVKFINSINQFSSRYVSTLSHDRNVVRNWSKFKWSMGPIWLLPFFLASSPFLTSFTASEKQREKSNWQWKWGIDKNEKSIIKY